MTHAKRTLIFGLLAGLGACAWPPSPQSHTDRATLAACRDYASQVYDERNRGAIYSINQSGLPYSNSYQYGDQNLDLAAKYSNQQIVDDCVRNTGTETNRQDTAPSPADQSPSGGKP
jgi:hypothetical protein